MSSESTKGLSVKTITRMGVLTAVVVVLELFGSSFRFGPVSLAPVSVPIALGAILYGFPGGCWLGLVFGFVVLFLPETEPFFALSIPGTILTVLVKGTAAGFTSALLYRIVRKNNRTLAAVLSAMACPVVNSGVFLIGCRLFFMEMMEQGAINADMAGRTVAYMFFILVGFNFIVEFVLTAVLVPVLLRLLHLIKSLRSDGS